MGFFDFIKPIGGIIKTLAPIVADAIPVVGPVINAALPALDGILSHDSTQAPDFSKPPPKEGDPAVPPFKLDDVLKPMTTQFQATKSLIEGVQESVNTLSSAMHENFASINSHIDEVVTAVEKRSEIRDDHKANIQLVNKINIAQKWLDNNKTTLGTISPNSGDSSFDRFLKAGEPDNLPAARKALYDEVMIPLQQQLATRPYLETVETYLLALHWLLILDKALIVIHGYRARNLFVYQRWELYLDSLLKLSDDIGKLRNDANEAIETLSKLVDAVRTTRAAKVIFRTENDKSFIQDDWPMLTIGYVHQPDFQNAVQNAVQNADPLIPKLSDKYDATAIQRVAYLLYRQAVEHALEVHLEPVKSVIVDLCDHVPRWNSRLPPAPEVDKLKSHIEVIKSSNGVRPETHVREISFTVTYLSSQGESAESPWTDPVGITKTGAKVEISIRRVTVAHSPIADKFLMRDPKTKTILPSNRGVARCVYAKVSLQGEFEYQQVGIFTDGLDPTEKVISVASGDVRVVMTNMAEKE